MNVRIDKNVEAPMRDGVVLRADVWRPDDDRPHPALLLRTPYGKEPAPCGPASHLSADLAAAAGYAVVLQDCRGGFASDGDWLGVMPAAWETEARDTYDSVEWVAGQPWCDGGVGLYGASYQAAAAWLGAQERPPHLAAMATIFMGDQDRAHLDTGGAFWLYTWVNWYLASLAARIPRLLAAGVVTEAGAARIREAASRPDRIVEHLPLQDGPGFDLPGLPVTLDDLLHRQGGAPPAMFDAARVGVPTLLVAGWYDFYLARMVEQFQRLRAYSAGGAAVRSAHRLVIGPWTHGPATPVQGEVDFGPAVSGLAAVHPAILGFFDRHLKGRAVDELPVRYFVPGAGEWRTASAWPPDTASPQRWYLHSDGAGGTSGGTLTRDAPVADEPADGYRYDPLDPVRTLGGAVGVPGIVGGPRDQARIAAREDVLTYTSAALAEPVELVGYATVRLYAASSAVDTDFVAKLVDVHSDGWAVLVAAGLARARYRKGVDHEVPLEPGVIEAYDIDLGPIATCIAAGHRLAVYVCSSDFPWFDRNLNTGGQIGADAVPVVADQVVHHDAAYPSLLDIHARRPPA